MVQPVSAHVANGVLRGSSSDLSYIFNKKNYESITYQTDVPTGGHRHWWLVGISAERG